MSLDYVNRHYGLNLKRGSIVLFEGRPARVLSATNLLHVRFIDLPRAKTAWLHPTWRIEIPQEDKAT